MRNVFREHWGTGDVPYVAVNTRPCRPTLKQVQVEQAVQFKFSRPENSTLEQVAQTVKFKVPVKKLNFFHLRENRLFLKKINFVLVH